MRPLRLSADWLHPPQMGYWSGHWPRLLRRVEAVAAKLRPHDAPTAAHALGQRGEDLAYWLLRQHGYTIIARNYRGESAKFGGRGEIDLIAREGAPATLVFVEVKTRMREGQFPAERAVHNAKRRHLIRMAAAYRARRGYSGPYRFDVVVIYGLDGEHPRMKLHRSAFCG